jgi:hypothetical protein
MSSSEIEFPPKRERSRGVIETSIILGPERAQFNMQELVSWSETKKPPFGKIL